MKDGSEARAERAIAFFDAEGRAILEELEAPELGDIDAAAGVLRRALSLKPSVRVGFLGESQVGKSSIINALVGQRVLPSGGVGPLTAQATTLVYAPNPSFHVKYHGRRRLNEFRFAIERYLASLNEAEPARAEDTPDESNEDAPTFETHLFESEPDSEETTRSEESRSVGEYLIAQARLLLGAPAELPRAKVFRWVQAIIAKDLDIDALADEHGLRERVIAIRRLLDQSEEFTKAAAESSREFSRELRLRAAGWMSPLVKELHVSLDYSLLSQVELVDLPGVGVIGDPAGRLAEEFIRESADALVIVMRNNGLTEAIADLLERTGVISRLLWNAEADEPNLHIAIAVTRLDDVAKDRWRQLAMEAREEGLPLPRREDVFRELSEPMAETIKRQIAEALQSSREFDDLPPDLREHREKAVRALCEQMTVLCVSAPDYLGLIEGFEDDCFLRSKEATNIPQLGEQLVQLASRAKEYRALSLSEGYQNFTSLLSTAISHQESIRRPRKTAKSDADERFRDAISLAAAPLREEAKANRERYLAMLDESMPKRIDEISNRAADHARNRLTRLKKAGSKIAWQTLNAALVRSGKFRGAHTVDYPGSLTRAFVDVIAGSWEPMVIKEVRIAYEQLADADAKLIDSLVLKISELVRNEEVDAKLELMREQIRAQGRVSVKWTQAQLEELSQDVRLKLLGVVMPPIERACRAAQKAGINYGRNARKRILEVFEKSGGEAIESARGETVVVLGDHLQKLRRSLGSVLKDNYDPISRALETIIEVQADAILKMSEARRKRQLEHVTLLKTRLQEFDGEPQSQGDRLETTTERTPGEAIAAPPAEHASTNIRALGDGIFDDL